MTKKLTIITDDIRNPTIIELINLATKTFIGIDLKPKKWYNILKEIEFFHLYKK